MSMENPTDRKFDSSGSWRNRIASGGRRLPDFYLLLLLLATIYNLGGAPEFELSLFSALAPLYPAAALLLLAFTRPVRRINWGLLLPPALLLLFWLGLVSRRGLNLDTLQPLFEPLALFAIFLGSTLVESRATPPERRSAAAGFALPALAALLVIIAAARIYLQSAETFTFGFYNPDHFGIFLATSLPFALLPVLYGRSLNRRIVFACFSALILAGLALSSSRNAVYLSAGAALALVLIWAAGGRGYRRLAVAALLTLAVAGVLLGLARLQRLDALRRKLEVNKVGAALEKRAVIWSKTLEIVAAAPLVGKGPGSFKYEITPLMPLTFTGNPTWAHNDYLQLAAEGGVILAGLLVLLIIGIEVFLIRAAARELRVPGAGSSGLAEPLSPYALAMALSFPLLCLTALFDFPFQIPAIAMLPAWLLPMFFPGRASAAGLSEGKARLAAAALKIVAAGLALLLAYQLLGYAVRVKYPAKLANDRHRPVAERLKAANEALQAAPDSAELHLTRGRLFLAQAIETAPETFDYLTRALDDLRIAARLNPADARPPAGIAEGFDRMWLLRRLLKLPPFSEEILAEQSEQAHREALRLHPANPTYRLNFVRFLYWHERRPEAAALIREFYGAARGNDPHFLRLLEDFKPDVRFLEEAVPRDFPDLNFSLGKLLLARAAGEDAALDRLLRASSSGNADQANEALLLLRDKLKKPQNLETLRAEAERNCVGKTPLWAACYAAGALRENRDDQARQLLSRSLDLEKNPYALLELSKLEEASGNYPAARGLLQELENTAAFPAHLRRLAAERYRKIKYLGE